MSLGFNLERFPSHALANRFIHGNREHAKVVALKLLLYVIVCGHVREINRHSHTMK